MGRSEIRGNLISCAPTRLNLNGARGTKGWSEWLDFFLQGMRDTANQAARMAASIDRLFRKDKEKIELFGRGAASALLTRQRPREKPCAICRGSLKMARPLLRVRVA